MIDQDSGPSHMHEPFDPNTPVYDPRTLSVQFHSAEGATQVLAALAERGVASSETFEGSDDPELVNHYQLTVEPSEQEGILAELLGNQHVKLAHKNPGRQYMS